MQVFFYYIRYFKIVQVCERRVGVAFDSYLGQVEQARVAAVFVDLFDEDFRPCVRNAPDVDVEYFAWLRAMLSPYMMSIGSFVSSMKALSGTRNVSSAFHDASLLRATSGSGPPSGIQTCPRSKAIMALSARGGGRCKIVFCVYVLCWGSGARPPGVIIPPRLNAADFPTLSLRRRPRRPSPRVRVRRVSLCAAGRPLRSGRI